MFSKMSTKLKANSGVNGRIEINVLRTNRTLTVLVLLQPINTNGIVLTLTRVTNERANWVSSGQFVCCE